MQAARCLIGTAIEFTARMERRENHFQRRFGLVFGVSINRDAAAIVADHQGPVCIQAHLDARGVTGYGFIH
jgi:hypothetical protein